LQQQGKPTGTDNRSCSWICLGILYLQNWK